MAVTSHYSLIKHTPFLLSRNVDRAMQGLLKQSLHPPVLMHNCSRDAGILRVKTPQKRTAETKVAKLDTLHMHTTQCNRKRYSDSSLT